MTEILAPFSCQNPRSPLARTMKRTMKASGLSPVRNARPATKVRISMISYPNSALDFEEPEREFPR